MAIGNTPWDSHPIYGERQLVLLLDSFLFSAFDLNCATRIEALEDVPQRHRALAQYNSERVSTWTAWKTPEGAWLAAGRVDHEQSAVVRAPVLWIMWTDPSGKRHHGWWHSYRPNEWIAGRGHP